MTNEDVVNYYKRVGSMKRTGEEFGISESKCKKILIDAGAYTSPRYLQISELIDKGLSKEQICEALRITEHTYNNYVPYSKGVYLSDAPTKNAIRIRRFREKKRLDGKK